MGVDYERVAEEVAKDFCDEHLCSAEERADLENSLVTILRQHCNPPANHLRDERGVQGFLVVEDRNPEGDPWWAVRTADGRYYLDENAHVWREGPQAMAGWWMSMRSAAMALADAPHPPTCPKCEPCGNGEAP